MVDTAKQGKKVVTMSPEEHAERDKRAREALRPYEEQAAREEWMAHRDK